MKFDVSRTVMDRKYLLYKYLFGFVKNHYYKPTLTK